MKNYNLLNREGKRTSVPRGPAANLCGPTIPRFGRLCTKNRPRIAGAASRFASSGRPADAGQRPSGVVSPYQLLRTFL